MHTLLIWESLPEHIDLYLIPNTVLDQEALEVLASAQDKTVNADDLSPEEDEAIQKINSALSPKAEYVEEPYRGTRWAQCWASYKVEESGKPIEAAITRVFRTGWLM